MSDRNRPQTRASTERASALLRERLKVLTEQQGTSVTALGIRLGYSRGGLRNTLAGDDGPTLSVLLGMAAHLGLRSIEELFGDFGTTPMINEIRTLQADVEGESAS